jgi:hypothetical protein
VSQLRQRKNRAEGRCVRRCHFKKELSSPVSHALPVTRLVPAEVLVRFEAFCFGSIRIDGITYHHDVVIDRGKVRKRKKKLSKKFRHIFGHTPLSTEERYLGSVARLVIGTGTGALPVMPDVKREAKRRKLQLLVLPTREAIKVLRDEHGETNAILHVTC